MSPLPLRRTLLGALVVGGLFGAVAVVQVLRTGVPLHRVVQPLLVFVVLGGTIGALAGPLVGAAWTRWRERSDGPPVPPGHDSPPDATPTRPERSDPVD